MQLRRRSALPETTSAQRLLPGRCLKPEFDDVAVNQSRTVPVLRAQPKAPACREE